jgi:hypothetical protein
MSSASSLASCAGERPASSASAARLRARARPAMAVRSMTAGAGRMIFAARSAATDASRLSRLGRCREWQCGGRIGLLRSGVAAYRATGADLWSPFFVILLARACEIAGHIEEAVTLFDDTLQTIEHRGARWFAAE